MESKTNSMKKLAIILPIASAIIWGAVIVGCSLKLKGTTAYDEIKNILFGGVITHIILLGGLIAAIGGKNNKEKLNQSS